MENLNFDESATPPWKHRTEVPDSQIVGFADQYNSVRRMLFAMPPGSGVLMPLLNAGAIALELYLKSLCSESRHSPLQDDPAISLVTAEPRRGHKLLPLLNAIPEAVRRELETAYLCDTDGSGQLRKALSDLEGTFAYSRYPFEFSASVKKWGENAMPNHELLMALCDLLHQFVHGREPVTLIEWQD